MTEAILRLPEVQVRTGLSRSTIYDRVKHSRFPPPINLGPRAIGWLESEVAEWITERVRETRCDDRSPE